jgi:hypothetical protein
MKIVAGLRTRESDSMLIRSTILFNCIFIQGRMMVSAAILKRLLLAVLWRFAVLLTVAQFAARHLCADAIPVKEKQGTMYGFLVLRSPEGKIIAMGTEINTVEGNRVRSQTTFRFQDGSIDDEVAVFTQERVFQLVSDHHIQKGPSFPEPMDLSINVPAKSVSWREMKKGKVERHTDHMDLPPDLANGMTSLIVQNFPVGAAELKVSYLAGTSKPRVVKLSTKPAGEETFRVGGVSGPSKKYKIHVEIGGLTGMVVPLLGKQPSDVEMWVTAGEVAAFLKMVGPLYEKGPIWTMQLAAPVWPETTRR